MYTLRKSLGQHFLRDENVSRKIVGTLSQHPFTRLLEVGPGAGALTKYLLTLEGVDFLAVELDEEKIAFLQTTWPVLKDKIIHASILDLEIPFEGKFTVIGNFPYNISSQILFKMLDWKDQLETVTGMFQKEVALRVAAKEGSKVYGVLSVLIQAFFRVEYLFEVHEQCFFLLVKTAFNQRRKTLRNAVKPLFDEEVLRDQLFGQRAEQLTVADFARLTWKMR
jgi:16S rRNA (adenine1518-N6/adenine1519-N6)-dimethyltransferase